MTFKQSIFCLSSLANAMLILATGPTATAENPLDTFELHPDFEMSLIAREPVIFDPVDLEFDKAGRAFVIEMGGYPLREVKGKIILLEDENNDGIYDTRNVFLDGLEVADSILPYRDGLLVASPPDLLFVADRDGDKKAEYVEVLLTGFPAGNTQHNYNGLTHGTDNWIYGANGGNNGSIHWPDTPEEVHHLRWNDFRIDIGRQVVESIGPSSGGFGLAFDSWGRLFETHNLRHIMHLAIPGRYLAGVPDVRPLTAIAGYSENGLSRVFPIGEQAPRPNHPEQAGFFSAACGITAYTGGAFPESFADNVFVADAVLNLVHRMEIHPDASGLEARRGRERVEFLASRDRSFRPVNMSIGPDGALYVLDMHREHIEHPEWIPDDLEADMDLKAGMDKGRIYRIVPKGGLPRVAPSFSEDSLPAVVNALDHPNKWMRDTAQRLLVGWNNAASIPLLEERLHSGTPLGRMHACWTLAGLNSLKKVHVATLLKDESPFVREQALIVSEGLLASHRTLVEQVVDACSDRAARVRRQALLTLSTVENLSYDHVSNAIAHLMPGDGDDPWIRMALLAAGREHALPIVKTVLDFPAGKSGEAEHWLLGGFCKLAAHQDFRSAVVEILPGLHGREGLPTATLIEALTGLAARSSRGSGAVEGKVEEALNGFMKHPAPAVAEPAWALAKKLGYRNAEMAEQILGSSRAIVLDDGVPLADRTAHLALLAYAPFPHREPLLQKLLTTPQPRTIQEAAMAQLSKEGSTDVANWLVENWSNLGPGLVRPATNILLYRKHNQPLLLTALEEGTLNIGQFNLDLERRRQLLWSKDEDIKRRAEALFSDSGVVTRRAALDAMKPALSVTGDPIAGQALYGELCAQCHQLGETGHAVGPNLTEIFRKSKETLLQDILDPNAAVPTEYVSYSVALDAATSDPFADESQLTGLVTSDSATSITLRAAGGIETAYERAKIESLTSTGLSLMPEGLELGHSHQDFANLLAYLTSPR